MLKEFERVNNKLDEIKECVKEFIEERKEKRSPEMSPEPSTKRKVSCMRNICSLTSLMFRVIKTSRIITGKFTSCLLSIILYKMGKT